MTGRKKGSFTRSDDNTGGRTIRSVDETFRPCVNPPPRGTIARMPAPLTPQGELEESTVHRLIGYQVAQASVRTLSVFDREVGEPMDLKPVAYTMLALVLDNPGVSPSRLGQALSLPAPTVTLQLDRLQARGWLRRERSDADRRAQHLWLTPEGERSCREATQRLLSAERRALEALSEGERLLLAELLHKVAQAG